MITITPVVLRDGSRVRLRPLAEEEGDRERLRRLFYRLSPESVYHRFMSPLPEPRADIADRLLDLDHVDREAIAALVDDEVVGVARYNRGGAAQDRADLAVLVEDAWQGRGLSGLLIGAIVEVAREHGIGHFTASILSENNVAIRMVRRAFPRAAFHLDGTEMQAVMPITDQPPPGTGLGSASDG